MSTYDGWSVADFRRHVPRIIAERDAAESAAAAAEGEVSRLETENAELRATVHEWETDWPRFILARRDKLAHTEAAMQWLVGANEQVQAAMRRVMVEAEAFKAERDAAVGQLAKVREASKALICDRDANFMRDVFAALAASPTTGPAE